ncbi:MAG: hypothetical protein WC666_01290 [Candidatus Paceibacterota bacterium]|jgi:hypothetical protein
MPPVDGVQFDEEKMNLGPLPPRIIPKTTSDKLSFSAWLMTHGIKSKKDAEMVLIGFVIFNIIVTTFVLFKYVF